MATAILTEQSIEEFEDHTVTHMGSIKIGRTSYGIEQVDYEATDTSDELSWLQLRGPRGASYILQEDVMQTGRYTPISLGSGPMIRQGNPVKFIILGTLIEQVR